MIDAIRQFCLQVIGEDEPETYDGVYMSGLEDTENIDRNKLRAEQRHRLEELLGDNI